MEANLNVLIWDFDGTLAGREGGWTASVTEALTELHPEAPPDPETVRPLLKRGFPWHEPDIPHPGLTGNAWWRSLGNTLLSRVLRELGLSCIPLPLFTERVRRTYCDTSRWFVFPDTFSALEELRDRGWIQCLLTNHVPELPKILGDLGMTPYFRTVVNSADTGYEKPRQEAFRKVLSTLPPEARVWMAGDNPVADVQGAERAGIPAILVRKPAPEVPRYAETLQDVLQWLPDSPGNGRMPS